MKRLFFALWPDEVARQLCVDEMRKLKAYGKPVAPTNIHVTLLFLGATDAERQRELSEFASTITIKPMTLAFDKLSYWKKPAVCCLTSSSGDAAVSALVEQLSRAAASLGIEVDNRPFKPHVTLLRKALFSPLLDQILEPIVWNADDFCLAESRSTPPGVEYRVIKRWQAAANSPPCRVSPD